MRLIEQFCPENFACELLRRGYRTWFYLPSTAIRIAFLFVLLMADLRTNGQSAETFSNAYVNFETAPVHPIALSPDGQQLAVCNVADGKLELFDVRSGNPVFSGMIPVGIDPVSVRYRNNEEAWVINQISDTISVVNVQMRNITATIETLEGPADLVFAGSNARAFISCAIANRLQVFVFAVLPQVRVAWTGISIYTWDVTFRAATVVGFFGAGGMGWYLRESVQRIASQDVAAIILSIIVVVVAAELLSAWLRGRVARAVA